jgi:IS30 family transposase
MCPKLLKAPFVCNGCSKFSNAGCNYPRRKYIASIAQKEYEDTLVFSREGIPLNKREFYDVEETICDAVNRGQHIYHAIQANNLAVSKSTVYRHIEKGYYRISKIDLPIAVKFKPQKSKQQDYVPKAAKIGRTYDDFKEFMAERNISHYVEMDTVIGEIGGKLIMTFIFTGFDFMFGLLLDDKTAAEAASKITALKNSCIFRFLLR